MGYKDTLTMMKTEFPMRAGLAQKEPVLVAKWKDEKLYEKMNERRVNAPVFMLHDGPPYANGDMHTGHALNRALKDFVIRYKNMAGFKTPFIFGWDTHGLPIESRLSKSGVDRKAMPTAQFRTLCKEYALSQVERQKAQISRMGSLGDYDHPYLTLLPEYEARQIEVFASMALKGLIFKGLKPVYWSWSSESALAEAEVEYQDVTSKTCYIAFPIKEGKGLLPSDASILIWTTTPWTIPSNQGISLNPKFEYGLFDTDKGKLLFLVSLKGKLMEEIGLKKAELISTFKGQELEYITCHHPLYEDKESLVMLASFVTDEAGTGCVHTDPDHGLDDFNVSSKYGLKPQELVDYKGICHSFAKGDPIDGKFYEDANEIVIDILKRKGHLLKQIDIVHSYPHDWRTHKPVIYRATPQWFCSISPIREKLLEAVKGIKWVPSWGEEKMINMIKDRADWCISRQRVWGVPIPIIYNEDGSPIIEEKVFAHIASLIRKYGSNVWFEKEAKDLLPEGYRNPSSPNGGFVKETDIMDVWFDSGSSWNGTLVERGLSYPSDLYLEGNDQYRGWFNASLILSVATNGVAPFKTCLTHGFIMTETWEKMSKSAGNGIDPNKIMNEFGADILRLWAASVDYQADARIGQSIIQNAADNYRKIRNTFRFLLGNLDGYKPSEDHSFSLLDTFVLAEMEKVKNKALSSYEKYDFSGVLNAIIPFMSATLSSFYLDVSKDVLYCDALSSARRKAIQEVLFRCAKDLCLLLNPILPFTMEEVYGYLPMEKKASPQLEDMPKASHFYADNTRDAYLSFLSLRDVCLKSLEETRQKGEIGSSTEARIEVKVKDKFLFDLLSSVEEDQLSKFFLVSKATIEKGDEDACLVYKATGESCARCRLKVEHLLHQEEGDICPRCLHALEENK